MKLFNYTIGGIKTATKRSDSCVGIVIGDKDSGDLVCPGYTSLANNPEVFTACRTIAGLISSMPIMLMENGDSGDSRIFNELSRKLDIDPHKNMTRRTWMEAIVMNLLLYGKGNSVCTVKTSRGLLRNIDPIPPSMVAFNPKGLGEYEIYINGRTTVRPFPFHG